MALVQTACLIVAIYVFIVFSFLSNLSQENCRKFHWGSSSQREIRSDASIHQKKKARQNVDEINRALAQPDSRAVDRHVRDDPNHQTTDTSEHSATELKNRSKQKKTRRAGQLTTVRYQVERFKDPA